MSGAQAFRDYYQRHADRVAARVARYRADDPTGQKKKDRMMAKLTFQYRRAPSIKLAVKIYALGHPRHDKQRFWKRFMKEVTDYAKVRSTLPYI